jgi:hypothetical protein
MIDKVPAAEVRLREDRLPEVRPIEGRAVEVRLPEVRADEVRPAEVRPAEVRVAEVPAAEIRLPEVRPAEVRRGCRVLVTPRVPGGHPLLKLADVIVVRHDNLVLGLGHTLAARLRAGGDEANLR